MADISIWSETDEHLLIFFKKKFFMLTVQNVTASSEYIMYFDGTH